MVKQTETIRRLLPTNYLSVFDHSVVLELKGIITTVSAMEKKGEGQFEVK